MKNPWEGPACCRWTTEHGEARGHRPAGGTARRTASRHRSLLLVLIAASPASCQWSRTTANEIVHYSFGYQPCSDGSALPDSITTTTAPIATNRKLTTGAGHSCMDGYLGLNMTVPESCSIPPTTCPATSPGVGQCAYKPAVSSSPLEIRNGITSGGFTIEAWLKADPVNLVTDGGRLIASLSAACPFIPASANPSDDCKNGRETTSETELGSSISFRLYQTRDRCLALEYKTRPDESTPSAANCVLMPPLNTACPASAQLSLNPANPQHMVITVDTNGPFPATPSGTTYSKTTVYIDNVVVGSSQSLTGTARDTQMYSTAINNQYDGAYDFTTLWRPNHVLHFGVDGYGGPAPGGFGHDAWGGELYMFAMYGRALNATEVEHNFLAGVDNSAPKATSLVINATEDTCIPLPSLTTSDLVTDYDNTGFSRGQALTARLTSLPKCAPSGATGCGGVYTDSACSAQVASAAALSSLDPATLYYKPSADAFSYYNTTDATTTADGVLATIDWSVSDGAGGSDTAQVLLRISAVNDAPVALQVNTSAYMNIAHEITVAGTDVDGEDASEPIKQCTMRITRLPSLGTLNALQPGGGYGAALSVNDVVPNITVAYKSQTFADTAGKYVVATDSFDFELIDSSGRPSANAATAYISILSGLEAVSLQLTGAEAAEEETPKLVTLRGINQRGGETWFRITQLPTNGSLYQYSGTAATPKGAKISALPVNVSTQYACLAPHVGWTCADITYEGDVDYFSWPTSTRDGVALGNADDGFRFVVESDTETSAVASVSLRVNNVNDRVELVSTPNVTFQWSAIAGESWARVAKGVQIVDRDRGVGFYQLGVRANKGTFKELNHRQPASGGSLVADPTKWQWSADTISTFLGYCPPACTDSAGGCRESLCIEGKDGSLEPTIRTFATPRTAQAFLNDLLYSGDDKAGQKLFVEIDDFDSQVRPPTPPPPGTLRPSPVTIEVRLDPEKSCKTSSFIGGSASCSSDGSQLTSGICGPGLIVAGMGWGITGAIILLWLIICCRQRSRTGPRDYRGKLKPKKKRAPTDQRCCVPLFATLMIWMVGGGFMLRSGGSFWAIQKMDFEGDGYCGPNATEYTFTKQAPSFATPGGASPPPAASANGSTAANAPAAAPGSTATNASGSVASGLVTSDSKYTSPNVGVSGFDNMGCTGGVPKGFMPRRMMGDLLVFTVFGALMLIEVSGRPCGRELGVLVSFFLFVYALGRFASWEAFQNQVPEARACPTCPSFIVLHHSSPPEGPPLYALGPCCIDKNRCDVRPFQNSFVIMIFPAIIVPSFFILCMTFLCACKKRMGSANGEDESDSGDASDSEESDSRERKRSKKKEDKDKDKKKKKKKKKKSGGGKRGDDSDSGSGSDSGDDDDDRGKGRKHGKDKGGGGKKGGGKAAKKDLKKSRHIKDDDDDWLTGAHDDGGEKKKSSKRDKKAPRPEREHPSEAKAGKKEAKAKAKGGEIRTPRVPMMGRLGGAGKKAKPQAEPDMVNSSGLVTISFATSSSANADAPPPPPPIAADLPPPPPPPPAAPPAPIEWFYTDFDNQQLGPITEEGLRALYDTGDVHDFTYVWNESMGNWAPLRDQAFMQALAWT